jgi:hypothetical protein
MQSANQTGNNAKLIAVVIQGRHDALGINVFEYACATQVTATLLGEAAVDMAGPSTAVLDFAIGRHAETLLGSFVGFSLGHGFLACLYNKQFTRCEYAFRKSETQTISELRSAD